LKIVNLDNASEVFDENRFVFGKYDYGYGRYEGMLDIVTK